MTDFLASKANRKRLQEALRDHLDPEGQRYYTGDIDGDLGPKSIDAIQRFRTDKQLDHPGEAVVDTDLQRELGLLTIQDPIVTGLAKTRGIDLLSLIGLIGPLSNLAKGKTMTSDQITGVVRTLIAALAAYIAGKGWIPAISPELLTAITTVIVGVWSLYSNRAKTIVPIADKLK